MKRSKTILIIALIIPIASLLTLTLSREYMVRHGAEVTLPITGYDPRNLLYGNYLIYTIDYGVEGICAEDNLYTIKTAYVCLEPKMFSYDQPENCKTFIKGKCLYGRFTADIEKFYAAEFTAKKLEIEVRNKKASVVLSVTKNGDAFVKYLLVDGQRFKAE